ncbi:MULTISPECIES: hypothetical protein [unclassified Sphingobacterium]|uniref:hypothetical protein n=1 Tax=unclassified Sphingobacterium TaxID=2609468 RepID=UPI0010F39F31|nr:MULTISPECIES: hypothetical protein [unclassified Sphingobacterium]MCS3556181.1 hypothetical protein [Sphingobacterium sp. JUb21]TCR08557.1 hypothetical protein EDF66_103104 [Sphingobacterium sp. JUb20]
MQQKYLQNGSNIWHHNASPRDIPEQYGVTPPSVKFPDGTVRYNRVYYRPK